MTDDFSNRHRFSNAVSDFHRARQKARLESLLANLRGGSADLLSYEEIRQKFRALESSRKTLQDIPIERIQGSVGRYSDFSRSFLPRVESDAQRWAYVRVGVERQQGLPPIEVYQVGEVYFILDGHHRVSVAREMGFKTIEAYVTPVRTRVPLAPGDQPDDLIIKAEYDDFLTQTNLDDLRPGANLLVTAPGQYHKLREHIAVHRYFLGEQRGAAVPDQEALASWYDTVYLPVVELIRARNLLRDFPDRTETDLYLWIIDHRTMLSDGQLGWEVRPERAISDLVKRFSPVPARALPRLARRIGGLLIPRPLEAGPAPGAWRTEHAISTPHRPDHLFDDLLVTVTGGSSGWPAVTLAAEVARRESARLTGLHVLPEGEPLDSPDVQAVRAEFARRCAEAGVNSRLLVESGAETATLVCQRADFIDLVVFRMNYPPPDQRLRRLRSGARMMIRRCSAPIFAVPDAPFHLGSALLAYGPGRRSDEALFVATYLAARWQIPLTVVTARQEGASQESPLEQARRYLEANGVTSASYIEEGGEMGRDAARAILLNAEAHAADFLIMGGYEANPLVESVLGSTVDRVLRSTRRPVLICR